MAKEISIKIKPGMSLYLYKDNEEKTIAIGQNKNNETTICFVKPDET